VAVAAALTPVPIDDETIAAVLGDIAIARGPGKSFCPSEAARRLAADWRPLMDDVRRVAARMVADGRLRATQEGHEVDPARARGPIRLSLLSAEGRR
jgi:hypothetical protein